jgi:hypothetical protein
MAHNRRTSVIPPKLSRRQAGKYFIDAVLAALQMRPSQLSTLTGHAAVTVSRYRSGKRVPTMGFVLDLIDEAPNAGFTVEHVAPRLGHPWRGTRDPHRHRAFAEYFVTIRVMAGLNRNQFAIKLGLTVDCVRDLERGVIPDVALVRKFVRAFLRPEYSAKEIIAAFSQRTRTNVHKGFGGSFSSSSIFRRTTLREGNWRTR